MTKELTRRIHTSFVLFIIFIFCIIIHSYVSLVALIIIFVLSFKEFNLLHNRAFKLKSSYHSSKRIRKKRTMGS